MRFEVSRCLFEKLLAAIETEIRRVESCFHMVEKRALGACAEWAISTLSIVRTGCDDGLCRRSQRDVRFQCVFLYRSRSFTDRFQNLCLSLVVF